MSLVIPKETDCDSAHLPFLSDASERRLIFTVFGSGLLIEKVTLSPFARIFDLFSSLLYRKEAGKPIGCTQITEENIDEVFSKESARAYMHYFLKQIDGASSKLKMEHKVELYFKDDGCKILEDAVCRSDSQVIIDPRLIFDKEYALLPEDLDFVTIHEVCHLASKDSAHDSYLSWAILAADVATAIFLSPYLVPLVELVAIPAECGFSRMCERRADRVATEIVGKTAAMSYFEKSMENNRKRRKELDRRFNPFRHFLTEDGYALDFYHPSLRSRLEAAKAFKVVKKT